MSDLKKRVASAIEKYGKKTLPKTSRKKKNEKPEKEVEREVKAYLDLKGCFCTIVDSKAVFSRSAGRYLHTQASIGCPDLLGISQQGLPLAIELKSKGLRANLSIAQYQFLRAWIDRSGFAVVVDSASYLSKVFEEYLSTQQELKKEFLLSILPLPRDLKNQSQAPLFQD